MNIDETAHHPPQILVVDGDDEARREVRHALATSTLSCREAASGAECLREVEQQKPDLVILGLYLPDQSGVGVCRLLRESDETKRTPIVVVSAQASEMDRIVAFESGVDDFLARPFYPTELLARIEAILRGFADTRRSQRHGSIELGPIRLNDRTGDATVDGEPVGLTAKEYALLRELASRAGRVVRRRQLMERIWGERTAPADRAIDAHVKSIRRKLGRARNWVETIRGVGYRVAEQAAPPSSDSPHEA